MAKDVTFRASDLGEVHAEARRILNESGPPPGPSWFLELVNRAVTNVNRRNQWNRRTAA